MIDNLTDCPCCDQKACCYEVRINESKKMYSCYGCGFYSSDLMIDGEFDSEEFESTMPQLHADMKRIDSQNRVWYPQSISIEQKGHVFANGSDKDNWNWSAIKTIPISEEEKDLPRFQGKTHKSDSKSLQNFEKDFVEALDYINFFQV